MNGIIFFVAGVMFGGYCAVKMTTILLRAAGCVLTVTKNGRSVSFYG